MKITQNINLMLAIAIALLIIVFSALVWIAFVPKQPKNPQVNSSSQISGQFDKDYSRLNKIVPGKSTLDDVEKINGLPAKISIVGDKTYLYYSTPSKDITNKVLVRYGVVVYALENVFSLYRGKYSDYVTKFGNPELNLYSGSAEDYPWYVFLKNGVAIQSSNNYVVTIVYFAPQNETNFMHNIASELGLTKSQPSTQPPGTGESIPVFK